MGVRDWFMRSLGGGTGSGDGQADESGSSSIEIRMAELQAEIATIESLSPADERLIGLFFQLGGIQELCGRVPDALITQRRLIAVGERSGVDAGDLAKGYLRLARLCGALGRRGEAAQAEARSRELLVQRDMEACLPMTIEAAGGAVEVLEPTDERVARFAALWPLSVFSTQRAEHLASNNLYAQFGISLRTAAHSVQGVLLAMHEVEDAAFARRLASSGRHLVAHCLGRLSTAGHTGALVLASYVRRRQVGGFEAGVLLFVCPSVEDAARRASNSQLAKLDQRLAPGTARVVEDVVAGLRATQVPWFPYPGVRGVSVASPLSVDCLVFDFLAVGPSVYHLGQELDPSDKLWWAVVDGGVQCLVHMPVTTKLSMMADPRAA